ALPPDRQRKSRIGVQGGIVLDLRTLAELDPFIVAAQDCPKPYARFGLQPHATDQHRSFGNVELPLGRKFPCLSLEPVNRHCSQLPCPNMATRQEQERWARNRQDMPELDRPEKWLGEQETAGLQCHHQDEARHQAPEACDQRRQKHELKPATFKSTAED